MRKKLTALLLIIFMMFTMPGVFLTQPVSAAATTAVLKNQTKSLVMVKGQKTAIQSPVKMTYTTTDKKVASVSQKGVITAKSKGTVTIVAKYKKIKWKYKIRVEQPKLSDSTLKLTAGQSNKLKVSGTTRKITWSSDKPSIVKVNKNGKVTAVKKGTATITAKINGVAFKCKVTVKAKSSTSTTPSTSTAPSTSSTPSQTTQTTPSTVWLSATGTKYHKISNCGNMNPAKARTISREEAIAQGYVQCSKCF